MTVSELRDKLNKLMDDIPNTTNDEISYYENCELHCIDDIDIMFDVESIGRNIVLK